MPLPKEKKSAQGLYSETFYRWSLARLKARLVAKRYSQTYGVDYQDIFYPVAKITSVRLLISLAITYDLPFYQLDIKIAFLHGVLEEEVYMK